MKKLSLARLLIVAAFVIIPISVTAQDAQPPQPSAIPQTAQTPQTAPPPAPAPAPTPAPAVLDVKPDPLIFKRTPAVDGKIDSGEWDAFYSVDAGSEKVVTYADWDSRNLYLAVSATKSVKLTAILDANGDGWFHGGDNYKFELTPGGGDAVAVAISRYDSKVATPAATPVTDPISIIARASNDGKVIEMAIPTGSLIGLRCKDGKKMGLMLVAQMADTNPIPQLALGDVAHVTLVSRKSASLDPVEIEMDLRDRRVTPGEELVSKLTVRNKSKDEVNAETFVIGGEGGASRFLNSEMVRVEGLKAGAKMRKTFRSRIPKDMPYGCWGVGAEVKSSNGRLGGTLISFEVVAPYEVSLETGDEKYTVGTDEWHTLKVIVRNNTNYSIDGEVKLNVPEGWQVQKNDNTKLFSVPNADGFYEVPFRVKLTDKAKTGAVQIKAEAVVDKQKLGTGQTVEVISIDQATEKDKSRI